MMAGLNEIRKRIEEIKKRAITTRANHATIMGFSKVKLNTMGSYNFLGASLPVSPMQFQKLPAPACESKTEEPEKNVEFAKKLLSMAEEGGIDGYEHALAEIADLYKLAKEDGAGIEKALKETSLWESRLRAEQAVRSEVEKRLTATESILAAEVSKIKKIIKLPWYKRIFLPENLKSLEYDVNNNLQYGHCVDSSALTSTDLKSVTAIRNEWL